MRAECLALRWLAPMEGAIKFFLAYGKKRSQVRRHGAEGSSADDGRGCVFLWICQVPAGYVLPVLSKGWLQLRVAVKCTHALLVLPGSHG